MHGCCPTNNYNIALVRSKQDPTRTLAIRKRFESDFVARWRNIRALINKSVADNDCFGLKVRSPLKLISNDYITTPTGERVFDFKRDDKKIDAFMQWLQEQDNAGILEISKSGNRESPLSSRWSDVYVKASYSKGASMAVETLEEKGYTQEAKLLTGPYSPFFKPMHADRVAGLYTRVFGELKSVVSGSENRIRRQLAEGLVLGENPKKIARRLTDVIDHHGIYRARLVARTEVVRAHHLATIQEYRSYGVRGVYIEAEWLTAGDHRVCPRCQEMAARKKPYTLDEIEPLIPLHPQCRCRAIPIPFKMKNWQKAA